MPHFFYKLMERTLVGRTKLNQLLFFACERLMYTPIFQALSLYFLAIFEVIIMEWTLVHHSFFIHGHWFFILGQKSRCCCCQFDVFVLACFESKLDIFITDCVHKYSICAPNCKKIGRIFLLNSVRFMKLDLLF